MLRVTRLHLLIAGIGVICLFFGALNWIGITEDTMGTTALEQARGVHKAQDVRLGRAPSEHEETLRKNAAATIATVGESYRLLTKQFGEVPPVSRPLRMAKQFLVKGQPEQAIASAGEAWKALKAFREKTGMLYQNYQVARGDTLWRIAAAHSPVHDGAGWVTIWKANKDLVSNFNRIEIGWTLTIPQKQTQYIMPFWKPRTLN